MESKAKLLRLVLLLSAIALTESRAAEVVAFNTPVTYSIQKPGILNIANQQFISPSKSPVLEDCVRKLKDFSTNARSFYRIRIEFQSSATQGNRPTLGRCTLDPR